MVQAANDIEIFNKSNPNDVILKDYDGHQVVLSFNYSIGTAYFKRTDMSRANNAFRKVS